MRSRRAVLIGGVASVVVLSAATLSQTSAGLAAVAGVASSAAKAGGNGNGNSNPAHKSLTVTGGDIQDLAPGTGPQDLAVVVSNPKNNTGAVRIDKVIAKVDSVSNSDCLVGVDVPVAQQGNYHVLVNSYFAPATGPQITLEKNDSKSVPVLIEMLNMPASQDDCKLAKIELSYVATATSK